MGEKLLIPKMSFYWFSTDDVVQDFFLSKAIKNNFQCLML